MPDERFAELANLILDEVADQALDLGHVLQCGRVAAVPAAAAKRTAAEGFRLPDAPYAVHRPGGTVLFFQYEDDAA